MNETGSQQDAADTAENNEAEESLEAGILSIEKRRWKYPGAKEQAIRRELKMTPIAYYQRLNTMIDDPHIIAREPALTRRLRQHRQD